MCVTTFSVKLSVALFAHTIRLNITALLFNIFNNDNTELGI